MAEINALLNELADAHIRALANEAVEIFLDERALAFILSDHRSFGPDWE